MNTPDGRDDGRPDGWDDLDGGDDESDLTPAVRPIPEEAAETVEEAVEHLSERTDGETISMSDTDDTDGIEERWKIGPALTDEYDAFELMDVSKVGWTEYRVLSGRNDSVTVRKVDVDELDCTCEDQSMNRQGASVCAHVAKCLLVHSRRWDEASIAARDLHSIVDGARQTLREIEDIRDVAKRSREADVVRYMNEDESGSSDDTPDDPEELAESWIERQGFDPDEFTVWEHDDYGSVNIKTNGLSDEDFSEWRDLAQDTDSMQWDGNNNANFVQKDDIPEVFA
jgi:hypothetical protein